MQSLILTWRAFLSFQNPPRRLSLCACSCLCPVRVDADDTGGPGGLIFGRWTMVSAHSVCSHCSSLCSHCSHSAIYLRALAFCFRHPNLVSRIYTNIKLICLTSTCRINGKQGHWELLGKDLAGDWRPGLEALELEAWRTPGHHTATATDEETKGRSSLDWWHR